jgi:perosamine synthetase
MTLYPILEARKVNKKIELDAPNVGKLEKEYLNNCIDSTFISTFGPFVPEFEEKFAQYVGSEKAVSTQSGTAALHMALYQLGIGEGDEVIVPSLTFIATINPVLFVGASPVIVDVDPITWNIEPQEIKKAITKKTKAIIPVHLYGSVCNVEEIIEITRENKLFIIEDATESLGATCKNRQTGTFGDFGCFSFNGNKLITTGGGGMIVSNNQKKAEHIKFLVNQARDTSKGYYHPEIGFNYRMTNIEASLGLAQLERIEEFLEKKRKFRRIYQEAFHDLPYIIFQKECDNGYGSWWLTCIKIDKKNIDIDNFKLELEEKGIPTRRIFIPVNEMPYLKKYSRSCPNACEIYNQGICLPSSTLNEEEDIRKLALVIREVLNG